MEITLSDSKSAIIPAEIAHEKCKVLIDTGASRSFIREDYVDTVEGVCNGFLALYTFFWFPEFSGYHQWQQESQ